jgi:LmbE family N-acetylglucosaminyl deacetylase
MGMIVAVSMIGAALTGDQRTLAAERTLRIIAFGAHPDDCEIKAGGVAAMWAERGHKVKFVSVTNGDIGHYKMAGGPLALRRTAEVKACAEILGIESEVLDIHDGELMPTLENRKKIARLIRDWQADVVLSHRPNDYHPDHRYTAILVQDAAFMVTVPFFTPDTPRLEKNPVFLYYSDRFKKPNPFEPDLVVGIDEAAEKKWDCMAALRSQFSEWNAWHAGILDEVPKDEPGRRAWLAKQFGARAAAVADTFRDKAKVLYGDRRGEKIRFAEAFELCEYGSRPSVEQLKTLFPFFDR